jgi:hypothetical protein
MTPDEIRAINIPDTEFGQMANEQNTALLLLAREFVAQYAEAVEISKKGRGPSLKTTPYVPREDRAWGNADLNS